MRRTSVQTSVLGIVLWMWSAEAVADEAEPTFSVQRNLLIYRCDDPSPPSVAARAATCAQPDQGVDNRITTRTCQVAAPRGALVRIDEQRNGVTLFHFLPYRHYRSGLIRTSSERERSREAGRRIHVFNGPNDTNSWCASTASFDRATATQEESRGGRFVAATTILVPYKIRPSWGGNRFEVGGVGPRFDFASDVTIGLGIVGGYRLRSGDISIGGVAAIGPALVSVPEESDSEGSRRGALSLVFGVVLEAHKVQVGLLVGIDYLAGGSRHAWEYHRVPWIGVSVGVPIAQATAQDSGPQEE